MLHSANCLVIHKLVRVNESWQQLPGLDEMICWNIFIHIHAEYYILSKIKLTIYIFFRILSNYLILVIFACGCNQIAPKHLAPVIQAWWLIVSSSFFRVRKEDRFRITAGEIIIVESGDYRRGWTRRLCCGSAHGPRSGAIITDHLVRRAL